VHLVVDIGNTRTKFAVFEDKRMVELVYFDQTQHQEIGKFLDSKMCEKAIVSASGKLDDDFLTFLRTKTKVLVFTRETPVPVKILYETPETLGLDRIAGAVAAWSLFPAETSLVIDMGTCITTNIINSQGEFLGGTISPGVYMRAKAMHTFTASLPLVEPVLPKEYIGRNTVEAMQNGVVRGTYYEILAYLDNIKPVFGVNNVILTGGDAKIFANLLNFEIFALPNLVLSGLHEILLYND
jgi:type III pantothenate kinase